MINWVVFLLILINLGVFAWGVQREHQRREPSAEIASGNPQLILVEEEQAAQAAAAREKGDEMHRDLLVAESAINPYSEMSAGGDREKVARPPKVAGEHAGSKPSSAVVADPIAAKPGKEAPARPTANYCYTLGPLPKRDEAEAILKVLRPPASSVDIRREVEEQQIGYWVVIPPMESEREAIAKVRELKDAGITDVWRFTRGGLANAISLGLFARESLAQTHSESISLKGFVTAVRPRYAEKSTYWIDARFGEPQDTGVGVWWRIREDYPDIRSAEAQCEL